MAIKPTNKNFGSSRNINYVGKDFATLKQNLIDYTKTYFPNTYSDFNEASPGMVFIEQAAAIGDVLSFYQDTQLKESMIIHASERKNIVSLAQAMGYKPKISTPAVTTLTVYQLLPSIGSGSVNMPDESYCIRIKAGMEISSNSNSNLIFRTVDVVDFSLAEGREIDVQTRNTTTGEPEFYLLTKKVKAISATEREQSFVFSTYQEYPKITLTDENIIGVSSIVSNNGTTKWYEVPYLAQESIFVETANTESNTGTLSNSSSVVPYILEVQKAPYRFTTKVNSDNTLDIQFGNGDTRLNDEQILPNTKNIGLGLATSINRLNEGIDPSNFLKTNTFGVAPNAGNGTLIVKYLVGGGIDSNVNAEELNRISKIEFEEDLVSIIDAALYSEMKQSIAVENLEPAVGGRGAETIEEIRQNALGTFGSQNRAVTREDYIVRALSMPERYGSVAKVYVSPDGEIDNNSPASILASPNSIAEFVGIVEGLQGKSKSEIQTELVQYLTQKKTNVAEVNNPFAINMYILGYNVNKHLAPINQALKQNLKTYLGEYRMMTDAVNIIDGFIVNIGVDFEVICYSNYNKREVLTNCLTNIQNYFNIDNWTFNKPINISEMELILANVEGVMSVPSVKISNLCGGDGNYSPNRYNIDEATQGKMVYPSLDPCIFEVKYPNKDIKGRAL